MKVSIKNRLRAFTLIELLVVISIIALLMSVLMPALAKAKKQAEKMVCSTNLKQLSLANMTYASDNHGYIPFALQGSGLSWTGWMTFIVPYVYLDEGLGIQGNGVFTYRGHEGPQANAKGYKSIFSCSGAVRLAGKSAPLNSISYGRNSYGIPNNKPVLLEKCSNPSSTIFLADALINKYESSGWSNAYPLLSPSVTTTTGRGGTSVQKGTFANMVETTQTCPAPHDDTVNISWYDGHSSNHKRLEYDSYKENKSNWDF